MGVFLFTDWLLVIPESILFIYIFQLSEDLCHPLSILFILLIYLLKNLWSESILSIYLFSCLLQFRLCHFCEKIIHQVPHQHHE